MLPTLTTIRSFIPLTDLDQIDGAVDASSTQSVLIFKHSTTCGTSAEAHEEVSTLLAGTVDARVYLVDVRSSRQVSNAIAQRFGIRHESPQILLLDGGRVRWHASHYRVNERDIVHALQECSGPSVVRPTKDTGEPV